MALVMLGWPNVSAGVKMLDSQVRPIIGRNGAFLHIAGTDHWV